MATAAHMSHEVCPDALPYIDQDYEEPGVRDTVNSLIEEETRRYRPTKNYLEYLPEPRYTSFETAMMKKEFERIGNKQPLEHLSMKRYELPQPSANQKADVSAWNECLKNSMAQLEHQATRITNLDLLSRFGADAWRTYNEVLQQMLDDQQRQLNTLRKNIQDINWERKSVQIQAGDQLQQLESSWIGLVSKNYEIERACALLEAEIEGLRDKKRSQSVES
ncbi:pre-mRNA-splicing factor SPF27-like [Rhopilema esculentum]|uniref:pre-mRNA-splicing factor SPF27-like n=1 Tax=Rhopilema esculentum TaxID=499914 RepID=UPI0031D54723|eukprot:gene6855-12453_t